MKDKYEVNKYFGIPVTTNNSGDYVLKADDHGDVKIHTWRTGKHTKGKFKQPGQMLLTENNLMVMIVASEKMVFKDRHSEVPLQRFTSEFANEALVQQGIKILNS